ncbi:MAG: DMT family protein, partial [Crocinitomicaceae bacterium]
MELKVIQEVNTLLVFLIFTFIFFKSEEFKWNHFSGLACL